VFKIKENTHNSKIIASDIYQTLPALSAALSVAFNDFSALSAALSAEFCQGLYKNMYL